MNLSDHILSLIRFLYIILITAENILFALYTNNESFKNN